MQCAVIEVKRTTELQLSRSLRAGLLLILSGSLFSPGAAPKPDSAARVHGPAVTHPLGSKNLGFQSTRHSVQVTLKLESKVRYKWQRLANPERVYIDLLNTRAGPELDHREISVDHHLVRRMRVANKEKGIMRVVFDLQSVARSSVSMLRDPPRLVALFEEVSHTGPVPEAAQIDSSRASPLSAISTGTVARGTEPGSTRAAAQADGLYTAAAEPPAPSLEIGAPQSALAEASVRNAAPAEQSAAVAHAGEAGDSWTPLPPLLAEFATPLVTPFGAQIPRVTRPPKLEDFLTGTPRQAEAKITDFRQREPADGFPVSEPTVAYLSYDDKNLYVAFVCKDEPGAVRAHLAKREAITGDDLVSVYIDSFHDGQRAYLFQTNPLGIQRDGIVTEGQSDDFGFDTLWYSAGRLTPEGFVVWMAIPFKSLRFSHAREQTWGIALGRTIARKSEKSYWPEITRRAEGFVPQMARLDGLAEISPGRNLRFIPYGIFTRARFLDSSVPQLRTQNDGRYGLDSKMVFRDALTLDLSFNPDFSQVESDDPQVTINQRFEVFFPEKRPFFLENAGFFETPVNLFFSRRIADPQFGARLTGKLNGWVLGVLAADDRAPGNQVPSNDALYGERARIVVARVKRELASKSSIGLFFSSLDFGPGSNRVAALDTRLKLNPNWVLAGQVIQSLDRLADGTRQSGAAFLANLSHEGRHFVLSSAYSDFSPKFRPALGFVQRADIRKLSEFVSYTWWPEGKRALSLGPAVTGVVNWDHRGRLQDWFVDAEFLAAFTRQTQLQLGRTEQFLLFQGLGFRQYSTSVSFFTNWQKWLGLSAGYDAGTSVNFSPGPSQEPFLANASDASLGITLRPNPEMRLDLAYIYSRLGTGKGLAPPGTTGTPTIFDLHLARMKLNYQFTRALSFRAIVDYNAVLPNPSLVDLERTKRVRADLLIAYLVHPGTALYIGYTDRFDNLAIDPLLPPSLRRTASPTFSTGRQFFIKLSYMFWF